MGETLENSREMNMNADELKKYQEMRRDMQKALAEEKRYYEEAQEAQKRQIQSSKQIQKNYSMDPNVVRGEDAKIDAAKEEMKRLAEEWREYQQLAKDNLALAIQIEKDKQKEQDELEKEMKKAQEAEKKRLQAQFEAQMKEQDQANKSISGVPRGFRMAYNAVTGSNGGDPNGVASYAKGLTSAFGAATTAVTVFNGVMDGAAKIMAINNRLYKGETEQRLNYMQNNTLGADIARMKMEKDVASSVARSIPLIGGSIGGVIERAYDKEIAVLERRLEMENASRNKLMSLAMTNGETAAAATRMQINQMRMRFDEGKALGPVLSEYAELQNELDQRRLQKSIEENIKSMKDNMYEMREELAKFDLDKILGDDKAGKLMIGILGKLGISAQEVKKMLGMGNDFFEKGIEVAKSAAEALGTGKSALDELYDQMRQEVDTLNSNNVSSEYFQPPNDGPMFGRS